MVNSVRIDRNVPTEMRDGIILKCDVFRPNDNGKYPVLLSRTPYDKNNGKNYMFLNPIDTVFAGYVRVVQDVRGRFASDGTYYMGEHIGIGAQDAYDTIEWLASQPWCDGNIGMAGGSYEGSLQWPAAIASPPHLKAIAPAMCASGIVYDQALMGGPPYFDFLAHFALMMGIDFADKMEKEGKDVSLMRRMIARGFENSSEMLNFLPLKENPYFNFEGIRDLWNMLVLNFNPEKDLGDDQFWAYRLVKVPVFTLGGWFDIFSWSSLKNFLAMREQGGSELARHSQHLLMGPWRHGPQAESYLGDMNLGPLSFVGNNSNFASPGVAYHQAFFDKYLKGSAKPLPGILYFTMGENQWHTAEEWPLPRTQHRKYFLHSGGHANTATGDGTLTRNEPGTEHPDSFAYDPLHPVPTTGGRHLAFSVTSGPRDQIYIEKRDDVLCYTSPELSENVEVTGEIQLHLFAVTSARDTDFTAQLIDVGPDGRALNMADGVIRARFRKSVYREKAQLVTPGECNEYIIRMGLTSHLFRKGHRMRIDISSSNFPAWDRNLNTGNAIGEDATGTIAKQTVYHQTGYCSYIDLPVLPGK